MSSTSQAACSADRGEGTWAPPQYMRTPTPMSPRKRISPELSSPRVLQGFSFSCSKKSLRL